MLLQSASRSLHNCLVILMNRLPLLIENSVILQHSLLCSSVVINYYFPFIKCFQSIIFSNKSNVLVQYLIDVAKMKFRELSCVHNHRLLFPILEKAICKNASQFSICNSKTSLHKYLPISTLN